METTLSPEFDTEGKQTGLTCLFLDLTDRRNLESSLVLSERMASLGTLAAGVGHEINNPLTYVLGNIEIALEDLQSEKGGDNTALVAVLSEAKEGAARVRNIVNDLRQFAQPASESSPLADVREEIKLAITMAAHEIQHRAKLVTDYADTPKVVVAAGQLGQVVLNLLINAAQAIEPGAFEANEIKLCTHCDDKGNLVIEVSDTGTGIPEAQRARVFEPFYTTKSHGTGLGLSISHRIVTTMGGTIVAEPRESGGTILRIVIPAGQPQLAPQQLSEAEVTQATKAAFILVVDDQSGVARAAARMLKAHKTMIAASGKEALDLIEAQSFDLILCDLMMPEMTGMDLYQELQKSKPEIAEKMLFMTGGVYTDAAREFLATFNGGDYLRKPFQMHEINAFVAKRLRS